MKYVSATFTVELELQKKSVISYKREESIDLFIGICMKFCKRKLETNLLSLSIRITHARLLCGKYDQINLPYTFRFTPH